MKNIVMTIVLIVSCLTGFAQQSESIRKWFSGIAVSEQAAALRQSLDKQFNRVLYKEQATENDTCTGCFKFIGVNKKSDLGLAVNPDSAMVEVNILKRVVYENEAKKKIDKKNFNGVIRELRFTYYFHEKADAKNAYKEAVKNFSENLGKNVAPVDASYEMTETKGGKKIKTKYKGITISHTDLADDYVKDAIYLGSADDLYILIIEREMAL